MSDDEDKTWEDCEPREAPDDLQPENKAAEEGDPELEEDDNQEHQKCRELLGGIDTVVRACLLGYKVLAVLNLLLVGTIMCFAFAACDSWMTSTPKTYKMVLPTGQEEPTPVSLSINDERQRQRYDCLDDWGQYDCETGATFDPAKGWIGCAAKDSKFDCELQSTISTRVLNMKRTLKRTPLLSPKENEPRQREFIPRPPVLTMTPADRDRIIKEKEHKDRQDIENAIKMIILTQASAPKETEEKTPVVGCADAIPPIPLPPITSECAEKHITESFDTRIFTAEVTGTKMDLDWPMGKIIKPDRPIAQPRRCCGHCDKWFDCATREEWKPEWGLPATCVMDAVYCGATPITIVNTDDKLVGSITESIPATTIGPSGLIQAKTAETAKEDSVPESVDVQAKRKQDLEKEQEEQAMQIIMDALKQDRELSGESF